MAQAMQPGWAAQTKGDPGSNNPLNRQTIHATTGHGRMTGWDVHYELLHRPEAYSCWSTASSARINNYGTRIDLILAAGPCGDAARDFHASVTGGDIWMDAHGSDHAPAYADLAPGLPIPVGSVPPPLSSRYLYTGGGHTADASYIGRSPHLRVYSIWNHMHKHAMLYLHCAQRAIDRCTSFASPRVFMIDSSSASSSPAL